MKRNKAAVRRFLLGMIAVFALLGLFFVGRWAWGGGTVRLMPQKTGVEVYENENARVDASNLSEGYLLVSYTGKKQVRTRVQITKEATDSEEQQPDYLYELETDGSAQVFSLTEGDGAYTVTIYENTAGNKYVAAYRCMVMLQSRSPRLPFLYPNRYVNFTEESAVVAAAETVTQACKTDAEKADAVVQYVASTLTYDYQLAKTVKSGYLPDVDRVLKNKKGICLDYAAVTAAMLRSQRIPCKLVVGYADADYHAWVEVYTENEGWRLLDPTLAALNQHGGDAAQPPQYTREFVY